MKALKIILAITALIGIGFTAGFLTHRMATKKHVEKIRDFGRRDGFGPQLYSVLDVTEDQKAQIAPMVEKRGKEMQLLLQDFRKNRTALMDSLQQEIEPHLTAEQLEKFQRFRKRMRSKHKKNGRPPKGKTKK
jgi:hypothetical protein